MAKKRNVLVMQSGGCTPVINRSLFGVVGEACQHDDLLGDIYGAAHGLEGVLTERLMDLRRPSKSWWERTARTPGAVLGSSRRMLKPSDVPTILHVLEKHGIGYCFIIGGNDSAETGRHIKVEAHAAGIPLTVINVPKTIDNDLVRMDHSPGYGSAARFVAMATMGAGRDAEAMSISSLVSVIEVMGRDAGWLAASTVLGKREERDAPHIICIPEVPIEEGRFLDLVENAYRRFGFAVAVVAENTRGTAGVLGGLYEPRYVDDFGHPYFDGTGSYLASLINRRMNVRVRYEKPGSIQRSMAACVSRTDAREAEMVGRAAVRYALKGENGRIVTLERQPGDKYACTTGLAPLEEVAGKVKRMPEEYLDPTNYMVTQAFTEYARPLIGAPLPRFSGLL